MSASLSVTIKKESDFPMSIKNSGWSLENAGLYFPRASPRTCMQIICTCILHWWVVIKVSSEIKNCKKITWKELLYTKS